MRYVYLALLMVLSQPVFAAEQTIEIKGYHFSTPNLTIPVGTNVKWINKDQVPHTIVDKDKQWRSAAMDTGDSYTHTFTTPGTFSYFCSLHPQMVATVTVTAK